MQKYKKKFNKLESYSRCIEYRKKILDISQTVSALHMGGALSSTEIVDFIFNKFILKNKKYSSKNTFVMSKGHSCIIQYILLNKLGLITNKQLGLYCKENGILGCHPDYGNPGIEASTGSLGHGMGICTGIALSYKINKKKSDVFCVISDGELQEGSTWESMMMAANLELNNLICFLDHNGSQSFGQTKVTHPKFYPILSKVKSFNWHCIEVDGHNVEEMNIKLNHVIEKKIKKPIFVICNTVKGRGVNYMENKPIWHYRSPNKEEYISAIKNLDKVKSNKI